MPQQQLDLQPYGSTPLDLQPYQSEQSWPEWFIDQGLRTIPAVGGAMLGSAIGPWGTAGGGAAGAALGSALGQWYEGKGVNPYAVATEGALGAIPFLGEAPGAGAGLKQIAKYAGSSALQGGVQGALGSVPRHIASTGQWELPSMEKLLVKD